MRSALSVLTTVIQQAEKGEVHLQDFSFTYGTTLVEYLGRYYGYAYREGEYDQYEYGGDNFEDVLNSVIPFTNKSIRDMLSELTEFDIEIGLDQQWRPEFYRNRLDIF